jgi:hypothetical protein
VAQFAYSPQSSHTRKMVWIKYDLSASYRDVFWMWNPRHHVNYFKTRITYEAYPESQDEVDEITRRFRLPDIIYDP